MLIIPDGQNNRKESFVLVLVQPRSDKALMPCTHSHVCSNLTLPLYSKIEGLSDQSVQSQVHTQIARVK